MTDASQASQPELWPDGGVGDRHAEQAQHAAQPAVDMAPRGVDDSSDKQAALSRMDRADDHEANLDSGTEGGQVVRAQDPERSSQVVAGVRPRAVDDTGHERAARARGSMLWAAYGDALGFVSELVDRRGLERRTRGAPLDHLMEWKRRIGGRRGVDVSLPAGCWSDDTQLRMAVSRSIGGHGFDVETFGRVELPVWLSYALGGGRASKAAAKNLGKPSTLWYANTFAGWAKAGGNGAAMRIHPHVWASPDLDGGYMLDVIADSVCTHGHPRAIVGACFHAATLAHCLGTGTIPDSDTCVDIADHVGNALHLIKDHPTLGPTWSGLWERETGERLSDAWHLTVDELRGAIKNAVDGVEATDSLDATYAGIVSRLGLSAREQQGSGILTTVAAAVLAATASKAHEGVVSAANAIGTDTDTIASMAGALLGACDEAGDPPEQPLDSPYLESEADRLVAVSRGEQADDHSYPDLLTWSAPATQADALVSDNGDLAVEGLGPAKRLQEEAIYTARRDFAWEWVRTNFGQTLLIKRRPEVRRRASHNDPAPPAAPARRPHSRRAPEHRSREDATPEARRPESGRRTLDRAVLDARKKISDDAALGSIVRDVAREGSLGDLLNFLRIIRDDLRR
ncbi:MAG: ADP-ribosylglycohydrolase family protein [Acidimicrobiaceae bacterium]|nr:ADP-ribosylglycohydrolase family protein [Acidimicrobiaceae bacterium]